MRMKTAISIRDEIFQAAERTARALGMSRSELYATAVKEFVARHAGDRVTEALNDVYGDDPETSEARRPTASASVCLALPGWRMVKRGEVWWAELPEPGGSEPGFRRPVLVMQSDDFNRSRIGTTVAAAITSNLALGRCAGKRRIAETRIRPTKGLGRQCVSARHAGQDLPERPGRPGHGQSPSPSRGRPASGIEPVAPASV